MPSSNLTVTASGVTGVGHKKAGRMRSRALGSVVEGRSLRRVVAGAARARGVERRPEYGVAFIDWLACACAGAAERAAVAARAAGDDLPATVAFAATAGHVLDYDDTFADGVAHVSAACAPAALAVAAELA